jgi:hypothetical protein
MSSLEATPRSSGKRVASRSSSIPCRLPGSATAIRSVPSVEGVRDARPRARARAAESARPRPCRTPVSAEVDERGSGSGPRASVRSPRGGATPLVDDRLRERALAGPPRTIAELVVAGRGRSPRAGRRRARPSRCIAHAGARAVPRRYGRSLAGAAGCATAAVAGSLAISLVRVIGSGGGDPLTSQLARECEQERRTRRCSGSASRISVRRPKRGRRCRRASERNGANGMPILRARRCHGG